MRNILIVSEAKNYLLMSLKTYLENAAYHVIMLPADTNAINGVKETLSCIVIYADAALIEQQQSLIFLKDRIIMNDISVFVLGDIDEINSVKSVIPKNLIRQEFLRPIFIREVAEAIDAFINQNGVQNKKKILVVDDSGAMLRSVKSWFGERYDVFLANSGTTAIKYLALQKPDLILLDYEMPICDGRQVLEMLRAEMDFATIPVMFLTNKGDKESLLSVKELKPQGYLLKSMEPSQIIKTVDDFFERRKGLL